MINVCSALSPISGCTKGAENFQRAGRSCSSLWLPKALCISCPLGLCNHQQPGGNGAECSSSVPVSDQDSSLTKLLPGILLPGAWTSCYKRVFLVDVEGDSFPHRIICSYLSVVQWLTLNNVIFPLRASVFLQVPIFDSFIRQLELQLRTSGFALTVVVSPGM